VRSWPSPQQSISHRYQVLSFDVNVDCWLRVGERKLLTLKRQVTMLTRMLSLIVMVAFSAASLPGQQPQSQAMGGRKDPDPVALQCGVATAPRVQARPAARGAGKGRSGDALRAGRGSMAERPDRTMETIGSIAQFLPGVLLQHQERLKLSDVQTARLQALQKQAQADCAQHVRLAMPAQRTAIQLLEATAPDFAAYAAKLKEASAHTVEAQLAMAKALVAARKVLTNAQRQTITSRLIFQRKQRMER
jgi:Spy/CpxP family protein refolding chaperone